MPSQVGASPVAFVTGAASGIGLAAARRLASTGTTVAVIDANPALPEMTAEICDRADHVHAHVLDLHDHDGIAAVVDEVLGTLGQVDILVNNVGIRPKKDGRMFQVAERISVSECQDPPVGPREWNDGSAAFADIDSGVAVAMMRNHFTLGDFHLAESSDALISQSFGGIDHG